MRRARYPLGWNKSYAVPTLLAAATLLALLCTEVRRSPVRHVAVGRRFDRRHHSAYLPTVIVREPDDGSREAHTVRHTFLPVWGATRVQRWQEIATLLNQLPLDVRTKIGTSNVAHIYGERIATYLMPKHGS